MCAESICRNSMKIDPNFMEGFRGWHARSHLCAQSNKTEKYSRPSSHFVGSSFFALWVLKTWRVDMRLSDQSILENIKQSADGGDASSLSEKFSKRDLFLSSLTRAGVTRLHSHFEVEGAMNYPWFTQISLLKCVRKTLGKRLLWRDDDCFNILRVFSMLSPNHQIPWEILGKVGQQSQSLRPD